MKGLRPLAMREKTLAARPMAQTEDFGQFGVRFIGRVDWCRRNFGRKLQDIAALDARSIRMSSMNGGTFPFFSDTK